MPTTNIPEEKFPILKDINDPNTAKCTMCKKDTHRFIPHDDNYVISLCSSECADAYTKMCSALVPDLKPTTVVCLDINGYEGGTWFVEPMPIKSVDGKVCFMLQATGDQDERALVECSIIRNARKIEQCQ